MKKIEITDNYTKYEDGSYDVRCQNCRTEEHLDPDSKFAMRYWQIEGAANEHLCLNCWKKKQDALKQGQKDERENDIHWGQAYNLAFQYVMEKEPDLMATDPPFRTLLETIQIKIYNHIKSLKGRQPNN